MRLSFPPLVSLAEHHSDSLPPPCLDGSPRSISRAIYDTILNVRQALYKFGINTSFTAYVGSIPLQNKWELQSHGITVVECLWNVSETMITGGSLSSLTSRFDLNRSSADMFRFALDHPSLGTTLVLISSSSTLAYTISVLGSRRYRVALISTPDPHNNVLLAEASEVIDWHSLHSRGNWNCPRPASSPPAMQNTSDRSSPEHPTEIEYHNHAGSVDLLHDVTETLEVRKIYFDKILCVEYTSSILSP